MFFAACVRIEGINRQTVAIQDSSEKDVTEYLEIKLGYSQKSHRVPRMSAASFEYSALAAKLSDEELDTYINQCHTAAISDIRASF